MSKQPTDDHKRLIRELDVLLNGEAGAAKQASLCDIVAQAARWKRASVSLTSLLREAYETGYIQGHDATVEGCYSPKEAVDDFMQTCGS